MEIDSDTEIPPRHEVRIAGNLIATNQEDLLSLDGRTLLLEPSVHLENLACARMLVNSQEGKVPVRICNPFDRKVNLKGGLCVGSA